MFGRMEKIFCVSFQKTGTTSLHAFLLEAGLKCAHGLSVLDGTDYRRAVRAAGADRERMVDALMPFIDAYDAFCDVPFPGLYDVLARRFPGARFILITRDGESWWRSLSRHWSLSLLDHRLSPMEVVQYAPYLGTDRVKVRAGDRNLFIGALARHEKEVTALLADYSFLSVDLSDSDKGDRIARFLGLSEVPPFPHAKRTGIQRAAKRLFKNLRATRTARP